METKDLFGIKLIWVNIIFFEIFNVINNEMVWGVKLRRRIGFLLD